MEQFAGWFYLPALKSLEIWLQSLEGVQDELAKSAGSSKLKNLAWFERLVLAESPIAECEARDLLLYLLSLNSLHLGLVYPFQDRELGWSEASARPSLKEPGVLLEGLASVKIQLNISQLAWSFVHYTTLVCGVLTTATTGTQRKISNNV